MMGTNYYWHNKKPCPTCGHEDEPLHIGKSSAGWVFALHVYPDKGIDDLQDWESRWGEGEIRDEYGDTVSPDAMRAEITQREWPKRFRHESDFHSQNMSEDGPNGLVRARRDRVYKHGAGTWDCHLGDFS